MDILLAIITGIFSSLVASTVWLFAFSRVRPKITISEKIAKTLDTSGYPIYKIKIINQTKRPIVSVRARLTVSSPAVVPNGFVTTTRSIELKTSEVFSLRKFDLSDKEANYAFRFITYENLDEIWTNDKVSYVVFRIYAVDSLSGLGKMYERQFRLKRNSIVDGDFEFGNTFAIS
jgi:hypothetical protein